MWKGRPEIHPRCDHRASKRSRVTRCIARILISSRLTFARCARRSCVTVRAILNVDTTLHLRRDKTKAQFCKKLMRSRQQHTCDTCWRWKGRRCRGRRRRQRKWEKSVRDTHYFPAVYTGRRQRRDAQYTCKCNASAQCKLPLSYSATYC